MEARFGAQVKTHPAVVRGLFDLAGDQTVFGERFVKAVLGQRVVDLADVFGRYAFADERVEAVEAAGPGLAKSPAFGRVGVHVVEMLEVGRVFRRLVVQSQGVLRGGKRQPGKQQAAGLHQQGADRFH